jgi:hypothetical protein
MLYIKYDTISLHETCCPGDPDSLVATGVSLGQNSSLYLIMGKSATHTLGFGLIFPRMKLAPLPLQQGSNAPPINSFYTPKYCLKRQVFLKHF